MPINWKLIIYSRSRVRLAVEFIVLYVILPFLIMLRLLPVPLLLILLVFGVTIHLYLYYDDLFDNKKFFNWDSGKREIPGILLLFIPSAIIMVILIWQIDATKLFFLARNNPLFLLVISIFYPVLSIVPQGLAYRSLFFHRYGSLFPGNHLKIIVSAAIFSFGHLIYKNALVLLLTFLAGLIFAHRYYKTNSLLISILEHSLYGIWLFTCGLGYFFVSSFIH